MTKYIIELEDDIKYLIINGRADNRCYTLVRPVAELEILNSDYINEHFGDLQDTAYQKGLEDGKKAFDLLDAERDSEYQKRLDDAWEAAKKIALYRDEGGTSSLDLYEMFDCVTIQQTFRRYNVSEAIAKLKAYEEQKADDEIKVGDEVAFHHDDRPDTVVVVTYIGQDGFIDGMDGRGTQYAHKNPAKWTKTGRHFDIDKILKEMSNHD